MTMNTAKKGIASRYYSIILVFAIIFLCIPVVIGGAFYLSPEKSVSYLGENNSIDTSGGRDKLYFLPYVSENRLSFETVIGFLIIGTAFVCKNVYEFFKQINQDFLSEIKKINIEWYQLSDGKK